MKKVTFSEAREGKKKGFGMFEGTKHNTQHNCFSLFEKSKVKYKHKGHHTHSGPSQLSLSQSFGISTLQMGQMALPRSHVSMQTWWYLCVQGSAITVSPSSKFTRQTGQFNSLAWAFLNRKLGNRLVTSLDTPLLPALPTRSEI